MTKLNHMESDVKKGHFFKLIFIYFLIPIVMVSFSAFGVYKYYKELFQKELESNYINSLSTLSETVDNALIELQSTTILLSSDKNLYDIFYSEKLLDAESSYKISSMTSTLLKFKATKNLIDSVYILHKDSNKVLDVSGTDSAYDFFTRSYVYAKYNTDFWINYKVPTIFYKLLEPTMVENRTNDVPTARTVIPFVTSNIESFKSNNLFIINLSEKEMAKLLDKYKFIPNSKMAVLDNKGTLYSSTDGIISEDITKDTNFLNKISGNNNLFEYSLNGERTIVITFSSGSNRFNDFVYAAFIPYKDFYQKSLSIKILAYSIIAFGLLLSIIVAYFMSKKIYSPIDNLVKMLSINSSDASPSHINEVEYLNNQIKKILSNETTLKKDLSIIMPLASEQYLIKILTNSDSLLNEDVKKFIYSSQINFKHSDFCVSLVNINFTDKYYNSYNSDEYLSVRKGISKMLEGIALGNYPTYVMDLNKNQLCLLINLPKEENIENITSSIKNVVHLFEYDKDLLTVSVGIGRIYSDFIGMNQSYNEARNALAALSPLSNEKVKLYSGENISASFHYSINDENKLYNYLTGNYKEETLSFLNSLIEKNYKNNPSEYTIKSFYSSIYDTIIRVIFERKQEVNKLMEEEYINLPSNLELLSVNDINKYIFLLVNKVLSISKPSSKVDTIQIQEYIKENYSEDLYLEKLAERFNTSDKYLSRLFKESIGTGFHEYLASIRIAKSKALLLETDLTVTKIGEMVGFTTHSTFFRIFKKYEGINPTQYRDNNKKIE
jgi:two-component system, response regulator YesN